MEKENEVCCPHEVAVLILKKTCDGMVHIVPTCFLWIEETADGPITHCTVDRMLMAATKAVVELTKAEGKPVETFRQGKISDKEINL